jgi:hypothetical protein
MAFYYLEAAYRTMRDNGGTFASNGYPVVKDTGFMVGGLVPTTIVELPMRNRNGRGWLADTLDEFVKSHHAHLGRNRYLGTWVNDGKVYVDVSQWVETLDNAIALGKSRGELAIWDCAKNEEVPCVRA